MREDQSDYLFLAAGVLIAGGQGTSNKVEVFNPSNRRVMKYFSANFTEIFSGEFAPYRICQQVQAGKAACVEIFTAPQAPGKAGPLSLVENCRGFALIGWCCYASSLMV